MSPFLNLTWAYIARYGRRRQPGGPPGTNRRSEITSLGEDRWHDLDENWRRDAEPCGPFGQGSEQCPGRPKNEAYTTRGIPCDRDTYWRRDTGVSGQSLDMIRALQHFSEGSVGTSNDGSTVGAPANRRQNQGSFASIRVFFARSLPWG